MTFEAGAVLPASVLSSGWFHALAVFVAINTLVYATISLAKLVPRRTPDAQAGRSQSAPVLRGSPGGRT